MSAIILFDGNCHFCNNSVQFIIKRDPTGYFQFASLQGERGQALLKQYAIPPDTDSMLLIEDNHAYLQSDAALRICKHLKGLWKCLFALLALPASLRNKPYQWVARNRYKWFGKQEACMLPTPEVRKRFLD